MTTNLEPDPQDTTDASDDTLDTVVLSDVEDLLDDLIYITVDI